MLLPPLEMQTDPVEQPERNRMSVNHAGSLHVLLMSQRAVLRSVFAFRPNGEFSMQTNEVPSSLQISCSSNHSVLLNAGTGNWLSEVYKQSCFDGPALV